MGYERILLDIETQRDFFDPRGTCYNPKGRRVISQIRRLFHWAKTNDVPVVSTVLRVRKGTYGPMGDRPHCIEGTEGEQKMPGTVMPSRVNLGLRNTTDLPQDIFRMHRQVIFEKRDTDIFLHSRAERLITELGTATVILCGAGVARGIVQAAIGLRYRRWGVILAEDAVLALDGHLAQMACRRMEAKGVVFAPTKEIITVRPAPRARRFRKSLRIT